MGGEGGPGDGGGGGSEVFSPADPLPGVEFMVANSFEPSNEFGSH